MRSVNGSIESFGPVPTAPACSDCSRCLTLLNHEVCSGLGTMFVPPGRPMALVGLMLTAEARSSDQLCGPDGDLFLPKSRAFLAEEAMGRARRISMVLKLAIVGVISGAVAGAVTVWLGG